MGNIRRQTMFEKEEYRLDTTINEFGRYIWGFTLYCAGRRTYAPSICEDIIKRNAEVILHPWRARIIAHVMGRFASTFHERVAADREYRLAKEAGDTDAWSKAWKGGKLGEDFDENAWMATVTYLAKHDDIAPELVDACWDGTDAPITVTFADADDFWFMVCGAMRNDYGQGENKVIDAREFTAFVKAHADDLNPKWVTNLHRDLTDDIYTSFMAMGNDKDANDAWAELRDFLVEVATPESREAWMEKLARERKDEKTEGGTAE